jgi:RecB family exonuclease
VQRQADQATKDPGTAKDAKTKTIVDRFEKAAPQITSKLEAMAGKKVSTPVLAFASEHLEEVAKAFAGMLRKNPSADRKTRARMFAKAILRSRKLGKVFDEADEEDLETLYEEIAGQLDGSPVLAQLVDEVTEGARKLSLG